MKLNLSEIKDKRIIVIEGIAGSGKDTIQQKLLDYYNKRNFTIYSFTEEELLFSWKHFWIKNVEIHRIKYLHSLLDYIEESIKSNSKNVFILNRFHITYAIFSSYNKEAKKLYDKLVERLRRLPVQIFIGKLNRSDIERRASHSERKEGIWKIHQQKRLKLAGVSSLLELYTKEQETIFKIAKKQGISYTTFQLKR